ncbi:MAG: hypothetical protein EXS10_04490 [Phycisphaerales bacterium]|nr:hypothetical protein [Phycisphaerales bacterium]
MSDDNSLLRNIGQFFGHVVDAIKHDPTEPVQTPPSNGTEPEAAREVNREVQVARQGEYILRRTTIDEVLRAPQEPNTTPKHETDPCP